MDSITLGIDFGLKNVRSCIYDGYSNSLEAVQNSLNKTSTPNQVSFGNQIFVGERAAKVAKRNRVIGYTTILGRNWDEIVEENLLNTNTKHLTNIKNHPEYSVIYRGENLSLKPEIISSIVFDEIIRQTGKPVKNVVLAIPQNFNQNQRKAILNSAKLSNVNVLSLVNKTTAAGVAFYHLTKRKKFGNVLIYHLGSESFDFTVCNLGLNKIQVLNSSGGYKIGGDFINDLIYDLICSKLNLRNVDEKTEDYLLECIEAAKIDLLFSTSSTISDFDSNINYNLTRSEFNKLIYDKIVLRTIVLINEHLHKWNLKINGVILIGNSCKIPILEETLESEFGLLSREFKDENLVAKGASIIGGLITKQIKNPFEVKEALKTRIVLNKENPLYDEVVKIDLFKLKNMNLEVCTNGRKSNLSVDFSVDFNGIIRLKNNQNSIFEKPDRNNYERKKILSEQLFNIGEKDESIENRQTFNAEKMSQRINESESHFFEKMKRDKEYVTAQNIKLQRLKESLNCLRDLVDSCEEEILNFPVPDKYKVIFLNLKKEIFGLKIVESLNVEDIISKQDCVKNYVDYLRNY